MDLMNLMEAMGTSDITIVAAFFIGLMMSLSPCPIATNITAIAYLAKNSKQKSVLITGALYALGRTFSYIALTSLIVWVGVKSQSFAIPLQKYGDLAIGPIMLLIGLLLLEKIRIPEFSFIKSEIFRSKIPENTPMGSFFLGAIFAMAFCPFSAVLFFGMLIPLAVKSGDFIVTPAVFGIATALPVIIIAVLIAKGASKLGKVLNATKQFESWFRKIAGAVFIAVGIYYIISYLIR